MKKSKNTLTRYKNFIKCCIDFELTESSKILEKYPKIKKAYFNTDPILVYFVQNRNEILIRYLLDNKFNPNLYNPETAKTALGVAVIQNNYKVCKLLMEHGANMYSETPYQVLDLPPYACPFFIAVKYGRSKLIKLFIKNGFDIFYRDFHGRGFETFLPSNSSLKVKTQKILFKFRSHKIKNRICLDSNPINFHLYERFVFFDLVANHHFDLAKKLLRHHKINYSLKSYFGTIIDFFILLNDNMAVQFLTKCRFPN